MWQGHGVNLAMRLACVYVLLLLSVLVLAKSFALEGRERPTYGFKLLLTHDCPRDLDAEWEITLVSVEGHGRYLRNDGPVTHDVLRQSIRQKMEFQNDRIVWVTGTVDAMHGDVVRLESELAADTPDLTLALVTEAQLRPMLLARTEHRWGDTSLPFCTLGPWASSSALSR